MVRFISAGIALATMAIGSAVCADELPAPQIRKTNRAAKRQALRPAPRTTRAPATKQVGDLQAIDIGTPARVSPVAMEGPSDAYRALERRIYGRSRGRIAGQSSSKSNGAAANAATTTQRPARLDLPVKRDARSDAALRTPAVRPLDLRKTYKPARGDASRRMTADKQHTESGRIVTRSTRGSAAAASKARQPKVVPAPATLPTTTSTPTTTRIRTGAPARTPTPIPNTIRAPRARSSTGAGTIPPDPAAPAIPRGPATIRRLDTPGCLDGT